MQSRCRDCTRAYAKRHYEANLDYYAAKARRHKRRVQRQNQAHLVAYFAEHRCVDCGEADPVVLQFAHVRGTKVACLAVLLRNGVRWEKVADEVAKCEVRCSNCHWRRTARQFNWYAYMQEEEGGGVASCSF
ncbi:MAG: hypothetical protein JWO68_575 [Actinomycetia bacterium]|nr:hypothetical protein [Actinomycetes bacterium]